MSKALRLFLVEDDDDFAYLMRKSLERSGHEVTVCHTGADALIVLGHSAFHVVLLDQRLPDMSGLELLQNLQREGIATPVLMVTGFGDEHLATQVLRAGALDYVVKDRALNFLSELPKRVLETFTRYRLQQTNNLLIEALESARDGVLITDLQGTIQHVNRALELMFGFDRQELIGQSPRVLRSDLHDAEFFANMWRTILARASWQGEVVNRRKDGNLMDVSLTVSPILNLRGQLTHFVGIYRDISERKQMERQLFQAQKMQSVGTLAGGVAHEFNNILAGIQGYASLALREPGVGGNLAQFLEFVVQLSDRAANLTRQLLAFARKPALSPQPTDMAKLLNSTAHLVRHSLSIEVNVDIQVPEIDGEPPTAKADANQLQQVLVNLALNSRDAMPRPQPAPIDFRLKQVVLTGELPAFPQNVPAGDYIILEVEDYGVGMDSEVMTQALDPFFTTKDVGQGTGLGLPVAFGIINGHQGSMTIETEKDKGTRVCLYLPRLVQPSELPEQKSFDSSQVLEPDTQQGRKILVIDDEEAVVDVVRRFLEIAGHEVISANSCQEALASVEDKANFDLVILDLMIPREDSGQNVQAIRERFPSMPILVCTGLLHNENPQPLLRIRGVDILRKPFRMNELWHAVHKSLGVLSGS